MEVMRCIQKMTDLREVALSPYYAAVLEEQSVDHFAPFKNLMR